MKLFPQARTRLRRIVNGEGILPNRKLALIMRELGYDEAQIRTGLVAINSVNLSTLVEGHRISKSTMSRALNPENGDGKNHRPNRLAQKLLAGELGLSVEELWPKGQTTDDRSRRSETEAKIFAT